MSRFADFSFEDLQPARLGVVLLAVVTLAAVFVYAAGVSWLVPASYEMRGVFDDVGALQVDDDVRVAGVVVGRVREITPDFDAGQVEVTWDVARDVDLGTAVEATIAIDGLLGGYHVRLTGPVTPPYLADLDEDARRLPPERSHVAAGVVQAIADTSEAVQELDAAMIERLMGSMARIADETETQLDPLVDSVEVLAALLAERDEQLAALIERSERVTATLADRDEQFEQLLEAADVLLAMLDDRRDEVSTLLGDGHAVLRSLSDLVAEHRHRIEDLVEDGGAVLAVTADRLVDLSRLLARLGPTLQVLSNAGSHGPWLDLVLAAVGPVPLDTITQRFADDLVDVADALYETLVLLRPVVAREDDLYELLRAVGSLPRGIQLQITWETLENPDGIRDGVGRLLPGDLPDLIEDLSRALQPALSLFDEPDGQLRRLAPRRVLDFTPGDDQTRLEDDELARVLTDLFTARQRIDHPDGTVTYDQHFIVHVLPILQPLTESVYGVLQDPDRLIEILGEVLYDTDAALDKLADEFEEQLVMLEPLIEAVRRAMR